MGQGAAPRVICRFGARRSPSCAGRSAAACSIRSTRRSPAALGGGRSTSACCGMAAAFLSLRGVLPYRYPLTRDVEAYIADEQDLGRLLDYAVIVPRLQRVYEWSAEELREPRLVELVRDGNPVYAWPFEKRHVWRSADMPLAGRILERATRPSEAGAR